MHHLWAHVIKLNPTDKEEVNNTLYNGNFIEQDNVILPKTDYDSLRTCPECCYLLLLKLLYIYWNILFVTFEHFLKIISLFLSNFSINSQ